MESKLIYKIKLSFFALFLFVGLFASFCCVLASPTIYTVTDYRWRNDDGSETTATWKAAANTAITGVVKNQAIRLRVTWNTNAANGTSTTGLAYSTSTTGTFTTVPVTATTEAFEMVATANYADGAATTSQLVGTNTAVFVAGKCVETPSNTAAAVANSAAAFHTNIEFSIKPTAYAMDGVTYYFKPIINSGTSTISKYATLTMASGTVALDSTSNANNSTGQSWTSTTGKISGAGSFNGINSFIQFPNSASLENVQESNYTVSAWFKPATVPTGTGTAYNTAYAIIKKPGYHLGLRYNSAKRFVFDHWLTGDVDAASASDTVTLYDAGVWHYAVGTLDRTNGVNNIYINGTFVGTKTFTANTVAREYSQTSWMIGTTSPLNPQIEYGWPANGIIDEVRIFSGVKSADWIKFEYYNMGSATNEISLGNQEAL